MVNCRHYYLCRCIEVGCTGLKVFSPAELSLYMWTTIEGSTSISVDFGRIQGSTLGPVLFTLFLCSLLKVIPVPILANADDIILLVEVKAKN